MLQSRRAQYNRDATTSGQEKCVTFLCSLWLHNTDNSIWRAPHVKVPGLPSFEGAPPGPPEAIVRPQNVFEVLFSRYKYVNLAAVSLLLAKKRLNFVSVLCCA